MPRTMIAVGDPGDDAEGDGITELLRRMQDGDAEAAEELFRRTKRNLRWMAGRQMRGRAGQTLQPTALVHEAYLRLVQQRVLWQSRRHFFGVAAKAMRSVLQDHARARRRLKRGGARARVPLDDALDSVLAAFERRGARGATYLDLDAALVRLEAEDPRAARVVELRFYAGLTIPDIAKMLGVTDRTVERTWTFARAWLRAALE